MQKIKIIAFIATVFTAPFTQGMTITWQISRATGQQEWRNTAFVQAAQNGDLPMTTVMLPICDINARPLPQGFSAMRQAAQCGNLEIVVLLTRARANVNIEDNDGCTPLSVACEDGHFRVVDFLLKNGAKQSIPIKSKKGGLSPLRQASQNGHHAIVDLLLKNGAREHVNIQDANGETPLFVTSFNNKDPICVDLLLTAKADGAIPTNEGFLPLHAICEKGNLGIVQKLVAAAPETIAAKSKAGYTPVYTASFNGHLDHVRFLINAKSDVSTPNSSGYIPLHAACVKGHAAVARELIDAAPETINAADSPQGLLTPLMMACYCAQHDTAMLLLEKKADPTLKDVSSKTALDYAKDEFENVPQLLIITRAIREERLRLGKPEREDSAQPEENGQEQKEKN